MTCVIRCNDMRNHLLGLLRSWREEIAHRPNRARILRAHLVDELKHHLWGEARGAVLSTCMPRERWQRHRSMHTCGERRGGAVLSTRLHRYWPASLNLTFASRSQSQISSLTSASRSQSPSQISSFTSATLATSCSRFSASLSSDCRLAVMFSANRRPTDANLPKVATVVSI